MKTNKIPKDAMTLILRCQKQSHNIGKVLEVAPNTFFRVDRFMDTGEPTHHNAICARVFPATPADIRRHIQRVLQGT